MVECRGRLRLVDETLVGCFVGGEVMGQEFESNNAVESGVLGFVDDAHAALAELLSDVIMGNGPANHGVPPSAA